MPPVAKKLYDYATEDGLAGKVVFETWEVYEPADDSADPPVLMTASLDVDAAYALLPAKGAPHPNPLHAPAICHTRKLLERIGSASARFGVIYQSSTRYQGGPRPVTHAGTGLEQVVVPIYRRFEGDNGPYFWLDQDFTIDRPHSTRVEARFVVGTNIDDFQSIVDANVGLLYVLGEPGRVYQFRGAEATSDGSGYLRALYRFHTTGAVQGFAAGHPALQNVVPIPALPPLHKWTWGVTPLGVPFVSVVPITDYIAAGGALPDL